MQVMFAIWDSTYDHVSGVKEYSAASIDINRNYLFSVLQIENTGLQYYRADIFVYLNVIFLYVIICYILNKETQIKPKKLTEFKLIFGRPLCIYIEKNNPFVSWHEYTCNIKN